MEIGIRVEGEASSQALYPLIPEGAVCALVTKDSTGRDAGGCASPELKGLLLTQEEGGEWLLHTYRIWSSRSWGASTPISYDGEAKLEEVGRGVCPPAFFWRSASSAYHINFDSASAEIEVMWNELSPGELVEEFFLLFPKEEFGCSRKSYCRDAEELLRLFYAGEFYSAYEGSRQWPRSDFWAPTVWRSRSRWDVRAMFLEFLRDKHYGAAAFCRAFRDSRPPRIDARHGELVTVYEAGGRQILTLTREEFLRWKEAFQRFQPKKF